MPTTALAHFGEDVARARAIVAHADPLPAATPAEQMLRSDLLRSAWMFSVGALDAYFCDAYTDMVAAWTVCYETAQAGKIIVSVVASVHRRSLNSYNPGLSLSGRWSKTPIIRLSAEPPVRVFLPGVGPAVGKVVD